MTGLDAAVVCQWEKAQAKAKEMGFECSHNETCFTIKNPAMRGSAEIESVDAVLAYLYGYQYGRESVKRETKAVP